MKKDPQLCRDLIGEGVYDDLIDNRIEHGIDCDTIYAEVMRASAGRVNPEKLRQRIVERVIHRRIYSRLV